MIRGSGSISCCWSSVIAAIMVSAVWQPNVSYDIFGTPRDLQDLVRDGCLLLIAAASLWLTPDEHRQANDFSWEPIREVAAVDLCRHLRHAHAGAGDPAVPAAVAPSAG